MTAGPVETDSRADNRCRAMTRGGRRCRNEAVFGQRYCAVHVETGSEVGAEVRRCLGITKTGDRCKIPPVADSDYCGFHRAQAIAADVAAPDDAPDDIPPPDDDLRRTLGEVDDLIAELTRRLAADGAGARLIDSGRVLTRQLAAWGAEILGAPPSTAPPESPAPAWFDRLRAWAPPGVADRLGELQPALAGLATWASARRRGDHAVGPDGADEELIGLAAPLLGWLYRRWFRVEVHGLEHLPVDGPALLVANRAGALPWDGLMIAACVAEETGRRARLLFLPGYVPVPFLATALVRLGHLPDNGDEGQRRLEAGELAVTFPEGARGAAKTVGQRYRLQPFGPAPFARWALETGAPVIPTAVVGAEEATPALARADMAGRPLSLPFFPLTPTFPWLGPLGLLPYPVKFQIAFGPPVEADREQQLRDETRARMAGLLSDLLQRRRGVFV